MEKFKVYGTELRSFYKESTHLKKVIQDIIEELTSIGMKVTLFEINGMPVYPKDISTWEAMELSEIVDLSYEAIETDEAIQEMYRVWLEAVQELNQRRRLFLKGLAVQGRFFPFEVIGDLIANAEQVQPYLSDIGIPSYRGTCRFSMTARSIEAKDLSFLRELLENDLGQYLNYFEGILLQAQGQGSERSQQYKQAIVSNSLGRGRLCS